MCMWMRDSTAVSTVSYRFVVMNSMPIIGQTAVPQLLLFIYLESILAGAERLTDVSEKMIV